jgi:dihydroorotate dehydrogenase electron transfer subunit
MRHDLIAPNAHYSKTPSANGLPQAVRILEIQSDNYRTKTFVLDAKLEASPGQFIMLWLPRFDEKPFSLVNADPVTVMITAVGPFTRLAHERRVGERLWLRGPFGNGFAVATEQRRLALVGGGYGVAPLLWLARRQQGLAETVTTIVGARTADDLLYQSRFEQLALAASLVSATHYTTLATSEDGSGGLHGRVTDALTPLLEAQALDGVFACGPHGMLAALQQMCKAYHVPCQLSWEAYMRCAIGICGSCEQNGALLCLDGPVIGSTWRKTHG